MSTNFYVLVAPLCCSQSQGDKYILGAIPLQHTSKKVVPAVPGLRRQFWIFRRKIVWEREKYQDYTVCRAIDCHILVIFMINAILSQNFAVRMYALFPQISLDWKTEFRRRYPFLDVCNYCISICICICMCICIYIRIYICICICICTCLTSLHVIVSVIVIFRVKYFHRVSDPWHLEWCRCWIRWCQSTPAFCMTPERHNNDAATRVSSMRYFLELYLKRGYRTNLSLILLVINYDSKILRQNCVIHKNHKNLV